MEQYQEIINICHNLDRKDLSELLEGLLDKIQSELEDMDDSDYGSDDSDASSPPSEGPEDPPFDPLDETTYRVHIDDDGFWSFVFSDDE